MTDTVWISSFSSLPYNSRRGGTSSQLGTFSRESNTSSHTPRCQFLRKTTRIDFGKLHASCLATVWASLLSPNDRSVDVGILNLLSDTRCISDSGLLQRCRTYRTAHYDEWEKGIVALRLYIVYLLSPWHVLSHFNAFKVVGTCLPTKCCSSRKTLHVYSSTEVYELEAMTCPATRAVRAISFRPTGTTMYNTA